MINAIQSVTATLNVQIASAAQIGMALDAGLQADSVGSLNGDLAIKGVVVDLLI